LAVVGARRAARLEGVRRAGRVRAIAVLRDVALAGGGAAGRAGRREAVRRAVVADTVAGLCDVADAGDGPADRRALHVDGARGAGAAALLGHVAHARRRAADRGCRREAVRRAVVADAVAGLGDIADPGGRATHGRALRVGRARRTRAGALLGDVADA